MNNQIKTYNNHMKRLFLSIFIDDANKKLRCGYFYFYK